MAKLELLKEVSEGYVQCGPPFILNMHRTYHTPPPQNQNITEDPEIKYAFKRASEMKEAQGADALMVGPGLALITSEPEGYDPGMVMFYFPITAYKRKI